MLKRFVVYTCFASFFFCTALFAQSNQPKATSDSADAKTLQAIEQAWATAERTHDVAAFEKIVADDWTAITPDGKFQTKSGRIAEIKASAVESSSLGDMKVRIFGNTAVVTGTAEETSVNSGKKTTDHYVWTDVFVKRGGKWVAVASQTAEAEKQ